MSTNRQFSRRTVLAATDVLEAGWYHADFTAFLMELGSAIYTQVRSEPISLKNRMSDLKRFIDRHPRSDIGGEALEDVIVERAVKMLPTAPSTAWERPAPPTPAMEALTRAVELDGYTVSDGALRRTLPAEIGLPDTESELMRLLDAHRLDMPKGHLQQAIDAHARGNWAGANGQIRTFLDALLDTLAERIDPTAGSLPTGQPRRAKLASHRFLSVPLNEWSDHGTGFLNGLIRRLHPEGPHPGLSDEEDSTFRLHVVLLTATLLLRRYERGPTVASTLFPGAPR